MTRRAAELVAAASLVITVPTLATAGWYWWSPRHTVDRMAAAVARRDGAELASHMDMPALRRDARATLARALRRSVPSTTDVRIDHSAVVEALIGRAVDEAFSVRGADRILDRAENPQAMRGELRYEAIMDSVDHFTARVDAPTRVDLLFDRRGASWRLTSIRARPPRPASRETMT